MFVHVTSNGYDRDGSQRAAGSFLMVFSNAKNELRCLVRHVRMRQSGHWMSASVDIKSEAAQASNDTTGVYARRTYPGFYRVTDGSYRVHLSGCYGGDGLPKDEEEYPGLWDQLHEVPKDLTKLFWAGGGHNSAGAEGPEMMRWATENLTTLRRLRNGN